MNRRTELKRTPLRRTTPMPRAGFGRASGEDKPAARKAAARPRYTGPSSSVKLLLRNRNWGFCEIGVLCAGAAAGVDPAHRLGKKAGGTRRSWSNLPSNLMWSCRACHERIDNGEPAEAEAVGVKLREGVALPAEVPVYHVQHGWVLLDDQGGYRPAPRESYSGEWLLPVIACTERELMTQSGSFIGAVERFGHLDCPGWSPPSGGPFTCGCGSVPFLIDQIPSSL